jgi:hypothetical protein
MVSTHMNGVCGVAVIFIKSFTSSIPLIVGVLLRLHSSSYLSECPIKVTLFHRVEVDRFYRTVKPLNCKPLDCTKPVDSNMSYGTRFVCPYDMSL